MIHQPTKVSGLVVTRDRFDLLKRSIECFINQTYRNKELVVLSQSDPGINRQIQQYLDSLGYDNIQFVCVSPRKSLGAMRNLSIELATGDLMVQWDDDDISHPHRIATQVREMCSGVSACAYTQFLKYFDATKELYWVDWSKEAKYSHRYLPGTVMFWKDQLGAHKGFLYPEDGWKSHKEEDLNVLEKLAKAGSIAPLSEGHHYVYTYHGKNVYDQKHHETTYVGRCLTDGELQSRLSLIRETVGDLGLANIRSKDGL